MTLEPALTPWSLLTATAALMAFLIGLYTLVGRERKSPYVINSVFWLFLVCLTAAAVELLAALVSEQWRNFALLLGAALLLLATVTTIYMLYRVAIRFIYFIDDPRPRHWPGIRQLRIWWHYSKSAPTYSHNTLPISDEIKDEITKVLDDLAKGKWEDREELGRRSLAVAVEHQGQGSRLLARLATIFIKKGYSVQYLTASRHPIEFVAFLKDEIDEGEWLSLAKQIVVIDAYTPHFGFIDSIYRVRSRQLNEMGVTCVNSKRTYAGIHTAASKAFNKIKAQMKHAERHPTLVIYEDSYALADLESPEQYRIFVRHVLPSERMWNGMFTVFLESAQPESDWRLLHAYASMKLDLRKEEPARSDNK